MGPCYEYYVNKYPVIMRLNCKITLLYAGMFRGHQKRHMCLNSAAKDQINKHQPCVDHHQKSHFLAIGSGPVQARFRHVTEALCGINSWRL